MGKKKGAAGVLVQLKEAIRKTLDGGETLTALAKRAKLDAGRLSRFLKGKRNLTGEAIEKVCLALRLKLAPEDAESN